MTGTRSSAPLAALAKHAGQGRAVPLGHDEAGGAEGGGGAQRGADILRVGHLIEHEQHAAGVDVVERDRGQRLGFERNALMHRVGAEQPVEILAALQARASGRAWRAEGASRCAAFSVARTLTTVRFGLASAASTACRPNSITWSAAVAAGRVSSACRRQPGLPAYWALVFAAAWSSDVFLGDEDLKPAEGRAEFRPKPLIYS